MLLVLFELRSKSTSASDSRCSDHGSDSCTVGGARKSIGNLNGSAAPGGPRGRGAAAPRCARARWRRGIYAAPQPRTRRGAKRGANGRPTPFAFRLCVCAVLSYDLPYSTGAPLDSCAVLNATASAWPRPTAHGPRRCARQTADSRLHARLVHIIASVQVWTSRSSLAARVRCSQTARAV
jgi:hypothetical protein